MFFTISKILWAVCQPLTALALLATLGLATFKWRFGKVVLVTTASLFVILGFLPIGYNLTHYLENIHPKPQMLPANIDGIIVPGGAIDADLTFAHSQVQMNDNAERITELIHLSRIYPHAKLVFTGGNGTLFSTSGKESDILNTLLKNMGFDTSRIVFESQSKNTYQNMQYAMRKVLPQQGEKWLLVTSAFHMPRSAAIFQTNGWPVTPYPAGYLTGKNYKYNISPDVLGNYYKLNLAVREIVGIIAYSLTERIKPYDQDTTSVTSAMPQPAVPAKGGAR